MKPPIYEPKGKAREYGDLALNIYTGCPHRCYYCFAPNVMHREKELFHSHVEPRPGIVEEVRKQLEKEQITGKLIHLCFTCDPYPTGYDSTATREIIQLLKEHGNHVQILTKGDGSRDFDLLDSGDWYGITYAGYPQVSFEEGPESEPNSVPVIRRLAALERAHKRGIKTWISMEPVLYARDALHFLAMHVDYVDHYKIGKLNYHPSDIDWPRFGVAADLICKENGYSYYIKDSLWAEMERGRGIPFEEGEA